MLSVTTLSDYLYCPRKSYLRYVLKFIPPILEPVVKGRIKHDVFDAISKNEESLILNIKPSDLSRVDVIYKQAYQDLLTESVSRFEKDIEKVGLTKEQVFNDSLKKFLDEASYKAKTLSCIIEKTGLFGEALLSYIPRQKSELFLSSKRLRLKGVIDRVDVINDSHIPIELKTGSMPKEGVWPGHKIQLASYILLLNEKFKSNHGFVEYLDFGVQRKIVMNPFLESEVKDLVGEVFNVFESGDVPELCKNLNKCRACNFRNKCLS